jgi:hypothetical protein
MGGRQLSLPPLIGRAGEGTTTPVAGRWAVILAGVIQRHRDATRGYPLVPLRCRATSPQGPAILGKRELCALSSRLTHTTGHPAAAAGNLRPTAISAARVVQQPGTLRPVSLNPRCKHSLHGTGGCLPCGKPLIPIKGQVMWGPRS